ncbi:prostatic acid phosphatase-like [Varanus komodoensis]|uniref:prostatic acid phosphatase-like n=1 Tax=Varanus komodoensis TaxID=61221 RepID=UPI001CF7728A|nr:prostatic acid phosphatase-like [Varanus komodoensis]
MEETGLARSSKMLYFFLPSLFFFLLLQSASGRELKFVLALYRHGDRSPVENYPTSLHRESEWPQGFGQLTKIGIQQQYELGQYIKKRYSNFLCPAYRREEILVQSSEIDRTIMSAQANLAGLFPPTGDQVWNPKLLWQPIPVHVVPRTYNPKLRFPYFDCPRYKELLEETMSSREYQAKIESYKEFIETIASYSGYDASSLRKTDNFKIWHVQDTLLCESIHNYSLPEWATEEVMGKLNELTVLSLSSLFGIYKREEKARLQGGLLLKTILENMSKAATLQEKRKMLIYSAHDTTLGALQMALNVYNERLFPYAACQFFELYQEKNGEHTIEMHFRNDTMRDPFLLTLPGCSSACPLSTFEKLVSPILVEDWSKECKQTKREAKYSQTTMTPEPSHDPDLKPQADAPVVPSLEAVGATETLKPELSKMPQTKTPESKTPHPKSVTVVPEPAYLAPRASQPTRPLRQRRDHIWPKFSERQRSAKVHI